MDFIEQLKLALQGGVNAQQIVIDLSIVYNDKEYNLPGNFLYILDAPDQTSYISVKANNTNQPAVDWVKQTGFIQPFTRLFITTPAGQAGNLKILIASLAPEMFTVIDNRSAISGSMNDILTELRGDLTHKTWDTEKTVNAAAAVEVIDANANRKGCIVQAKASNTGKIYIGFNNLVTTTKWVAELQPGQSFSIDDYRGDIWARSDTAGQLLGWGEW